MRAPAHGRLVIRYNSLDELDGILSHLRSDLSLCDFLKASAFISIIAPRLSGRP